MSNLRDLNNPFFDLLNSIGAQGANHPFFAPFNPEARDRGAPPSYNAGNNPNPDANTPPSSDEDAPHQAPPENPPHHGPHSGHRRGGYCGRGGWGARGGCGARGGRGLWGSRGPRFDPWGMAGGFDMSKLQDFISHFAPEEAGEQSNTGGKDFTPEADIFDTEDAFVVHVSLPGAKKDDVGVNWNADHSELNVAGVIYRPGDEQFLQKLAVDGRKVGVFEKKIKLGSKQAPAPVDSDGIAAKMEDGILVITVPKLEKEFVEVKKVDIE